jgi:signal transduction histidine kinase/CheY-like chemotaxis protein
MFLFVLKTHIQLNIMKKTFILFLLVTAINVIAQTKNDSLLNLINNNMLPDSTLRDAYDAILENMKESNLGSFLEIANKGLKKAEENEDLFLKLIIHHRMGETYMIHDNYNQTHIHWLETLKIAEKLENLSHISRSLNNLVGLYSSTKEYDKALEYNERSIEIAKQENDLIRVAVYKFQKVHLYLQISRFEEADKILKEIAHEVKNFDNPQRRIAALSTIGNVYGKIATNLMEGKERKDYLNKSLDYYFKCLDEALEYGAENYLASIKLNIGDTYLVLNEEEPGYAYLREAIEIAKRINNLSRLQSAYTALERYHYREKRFENAYFYLDSVRLISDSILNIDTKSKIHDLQIKYETEKKEAENNRLKEVNHRQQLLNKVYLLFFFVTFFLLSILTVLFYKNKKKKLRLERSQKELEELNRNLQKSKEETEKALEFKSLFLANMSHEIRTPLNIIIGFNSILNKNISDPKLKKYIQSIETGSYNLLRFLNDILDMSKIEAGKVMLNHEIINLKTMVFDLKELFILKAEEKGLQLNVEIDNNTPQGILFDEVRLRQILVNLIGNAIKFTEDGYVNINVSAPGINKYQNELATKSTIQISISDTGIGITKDDQQQIFDSFKQVNLKERKNIGGTGLGLAISKRLTEILGGRIAVESEKGKGSIFTVTFKNVPVAHYSEETAIAHELPDKKVDYDFEESILLIADDEEMNRSLISVCFENTKVKVIEAVNGSEAVELATTQQPKVILMDLKMPLMDGIEAARIIKNNNSLKHLNIIAFSASSIFNSLSNEDSELFSGFLSKPLVVDELFEKMADFIPHKITVQQQKFSPDKAFQFSFRNDLPKITNKINDQLQNNFANQWQAIHNTNSIKMIIDFATELKTYSMKQKLSGLESYAQAIIDAANGFDVEDVKKLLRQFPDILQLLKI